MFAPAFETYEGSYEAGNRFWNALCAGAMHFPRHTERRNCACHGTGGCHRIWLRRQRVPGLPGRCCCLGGLLREESCCGRAGRCSGRTASIG